MVNRNNYLLVREHLNYLHEVEQLSQPSVERYWFSLRHLLLWADERLFQDVADLRPTFPVYISNLSGKNQREKLAAVSQKKIIRTAKRFFNWVKLQFPDRFSCLPAAWIETLKPPRGIHTYGEHQYVTMDEAVKLATLPVDAKDIATKRDQAAVAMLFLSGMRAGAFASLPIDAVDIAGKCIRQWPELGVRTKFNKKATTFLLPIPELIEVVKHWDQFVRENLPVDMLWYASLKSNWGEITLEMGPVGKNRPQRLAKRLRMLYEKARLPYQSPHKFRHGHAVYGLQHAKTMADYKAVSMNLMHGDIKVTDEIYAPILPDEVGQRIANMSDDQSPVVGSDLETLLKINTADPELLGALAVIFKKLS